MLLARISSIFISAIRRLFLSRRLYSRHSRALLRAQYAPATHAYIPPLPHQPVACSTGELQQHIDQAVQTLDNAFCLSWRGLERILNRSFSRDEAVDILRYLHQTGCSLRHLRRSPEAQEHLRMLLAVRSNDEALLQRGGR